MDSSSEVIGTGALVVASVSGFIGVFGVVVGTLLTLKEQRKHREYVHRERVRAAYAAWAKTVDMLTELEGAMLNRSIEMARLHADPDPSSEVARLHVMRRLDEDGHKLAWRVMQANTREAAAFFALMTLDHGSEEVRLAAEIRDMKPGHQVMKAVPLQSVNALTYEEFLRLERKQAEKKGILAAKLCARFGRPVNAS